jgi:uncharacterized protein YjeT (DUF2065 family)
MTTSPAQRRTATRPARIEWIVVAVLALAAAAFAFTVARHGWFYADAWGHLARRTITDPASLLRPQGGHLAVVGAVVMRTLYGIAHLDYSPLFPAASAAAWASFGAVAWWWFRRRGAHPVVAIGSAAVLLFVGTGGWLQAWLVGNPFGLVAVIAAAHLVATTERPGPRHHVAAVLLILAALSSGGTGLTGTIGLGLAVLAAGRLLRWWPGFAVGAAAYGTWYLANRGTVRQLRPDLGLGEMITDLPAAVVRLWHLAPARLFRLPDTAGWVLLVLLVAWVASLVVRRRADLPTSAFLFGAFAFSVLAAGVRVVTGEAAPGDQLRYSHNIIVFSVLALAPHIPVPPRRWGPAAVATLAAALTVVNAVALHAELEDSAQIGRGGRRVVEAAGAMIGAGEPVVDGFSLGLREGFLKEDEIRAFLDDGWNPPPAAADDPTRGTLRIRRLPGRPPGWTTGSATAAATFVEDGCVRARPGNGVEIVVTGESTLRLTSRSAFAVGLEWSDRFGTGARSFDAEAGTPLFFATAEPDGPALLTVTTGAALRVCGLAPLP